MKKFIFLFILFVYITPAHAEDSLLSKMNTLLINAPDSRNWQVRSSVVARWIREGREDFLVVDVRDNESEFYSGHIPGAISIPYNMLLDEVNLMQLPKNKKIILASVTGQTQNIPILVLRALGYDAYTLAFGHSGWIKGYYGGKILRGAVNTARYPIKKERRPVETDPIPPEDKPVKPL